MTKAQRAVIEECIRKAQRGPSMAFIWTDCTPEEAENQARIWAESWIGDPLRMLLENVDGNLPARELGKYGR